ncbi:MAG TPA: HYR domain-containing protein [Blastocatellia bacterium]
MKKQLAFVGLAAGVMLILITSAILGARASVGSLGTQSVRQLARLSDRVTVRAAGRGAPRMNLTDGREVLTSYTGEAEALRQQKLAEPITMAAADFDEDGMPDLITGYAGPGAWLMTLYSGNVDAIFPNSPEAQQRKQRGEFTDAPFLSPARVFTVPEKPEFIGTGDFNADGHADIALCARGSNLLFMLLGDGAGNFGYVKAVPLAGRVTTMTTSEASIDVAVAGTDGPKLLVFESARGFANPETISLPDEATALATGHFDNISEFEIAAASGNTLLIIRRQAGEGAQPWQQGILRTFGFSIKSFAVGKFTGGQLDDLAMLCDDGNARTLSRPSASSSAIIVSSALEGVSKLIATHLSSLPVDTLVAVNPGRHRLHLFAGNGDESADVRSASVSATLDVEGEPAAALPMRLNGDALSDLVILRKDQLAPTVMFTPAVMTFTVTNTGDNGGVNPIPFASTGTLRQAIVDANANPGADLINFALGGGTPSINILAPLPPLAEAVTINGNTGGATRVELNGAAAGAGADGLDLVSANNSVQFLVINRFSAAGIAIRPGGSSMVQGCFIGINAGGNAALPNAQGGISVGSQGNTIGGTTAQARNVISGNGGNFGVGLIGIQPVNNLVQGNFIGTDVGGGPLGNAGSGVFMADTGSNNTIGGTLAGAGNTIAFNNGTAGVTLLGSVVGDAVLSNSIFSNVGLGIDLNGDGVTPNLHCGAGIGSNNGATFPVLTSATTNGANTVVNGTLDSKPGLSFRIEFFSNANCDPSGNGEGRTFLGSSVVITLSGSCIGNFNATLPPVAVGTIITSTATDPSNNTSEFSACITTVAAPACTITCPPDQVSSSSPTQCGTTVTYPAPVASVACGAVSCAPPSGSFFGSGTTTVICTTANGPSCSFLVTVVDNTPPTITCPGSIITSTEPGQASAAVTFNTTATDNCPSVSVKCTPPSGSRFSAGATVVSCTATDGSNNTASCLFNVVVVDNEPPAIKCPPNVSADAGPTQCSAVVTFPAPVATDNVPGVIVACTPASGTTFPVGVTTVTCTATDVAGNKTPCTFTVNLTGGPTQAVITPASVDLRAVNVFSFKAKKRTATGEFSIQNTGCGRMTLTFKAITRVTDQAKLSDADDSAFFSFFRRGPDGSPTGANLLGQQVTIDAGAANQQTFIVQFRPPGPPVDRGSSPLRAIDVVPNSFQSVLSFTGTDKTVTFNAGAKPGVQLIDPLVSICRSGDQFIITFHVYDSNKADVATATFEFLDNSDRVIGTISNVDLAGPISQANIVNGQSFTVIQNTTVDDRVSKVRVTVFGSSSSDQATSSGLQSTCAASVAPLSTRHQVALPVIRLDGLRP